MMERKDFEEKYEKLNDKQGQVLKLFLQGKSEEAIAKSCGVSNSSSVRHHISNICELFGFKNEPGERFRQRDQLIPLFAKYKRELVSDQLIKRSGISSDDREELNFYYVERHPIESECCDKILESGAVIRIKAPKYTGKTLLLKRIIERAKDHNYKAVTLDFNQASSSVFSSYEELLKWLCKRVGRGLGLENKLAEYWDSDEFDEHTNTQTYFEDYLLKNQTQPLVLAFKNVDRVFEQEPFRIDFCRLLRCWSQLYVEANLFAELWKKLRLIIVHSTNVYGSFDINVSPLKGVGFTPDLLDFTPAQVDYLANCYQLQGLNLDILNQFRKIFGGHPYLIQEAFVFLQKEQCCLDRLLEIAATEASPFISHLREQLEELRKNPQLETAYYQVVKETQPVRLDTNVTFKLQGMGLVLVDLNHCLPRCDLYRQYFFDRLNPN